LARGWQLTASIMKALESIELANVTGGQSPIPPADYSGWIGALSNRGLRPMRYGDWVVRRAGGWKNIPHAR